MMQCANGEGSNPAEARTRTVSAKNMNLTLFGLTFRLYIKHYLIQIGIL